MKLVHILDSDLAALHTMSCGAIKAFLLHSGESEGGDGGLRMRDYF